MLKYNEKGVDVCVMGIAPDDEVQNMVTIG
jgi:hypothetical protein